MASSEAGRTTTEYIQHHLQNLVLGVHPENGLSIAHGSEEAAAMGFWAIHLDSMFWSIGLGLLFLWLFKKGADRDLYKILLSYWLNSLTKTYVKHSMVKANW